MKFIIDNFQSIEHLEVDFNGFTTITGDTDRGKSATVRAIRALLFNDWSPTYLRLGEKECRLQCVLDRPINGVVGFELIKSAKDNKYNVFYESGDTLSFPKTGVETPDEIKQLGFDVLLTNRDEKYNLNFQSQLEGLFLLSDSDVSFSSFLNTLFNVDKYEIALRDINKDVKSFNRRIADIGTESIEVESQLKQAEQSVKGTQQSLTTFKALADNIRSMKEGVSEREEALESHSAITGRLEKVEEESSYLKLAKVIPLDVSDDYRNIPTQAGALERHKVLVDRLGDTEKNNSYLQVSEGIALPDPKKFKSIPKLMSSISMVNKLERTLGKIESYNSLLEEFTLDVSEVKDRVESVIGAMSSLEKLNTDLDRVKGDSDKLLIYEAIMAELVDETKSKVGVCPICKKPIDR